MKHIQHPTQIQWRLTRIESPPSLIETHQHSVSRNIYSSPPKQLKIMPLQRILLWILFMVSIIKIRSISAFCPSKCQCMGGDNNSRAYCVDAALEDVPIQLNPQTKYINLTMNRIRSIEYTLPFYMKLEILDLSRNIIESLDSKNFEFQTKMRTLNLSRNSVSSLQKDTFQGLSNLLVLDLSYNRIEEVHQSAMNDLRSLIELDLTNNNIVSLEDNTFNQLMSLEILIFKNNQLLDIPANNLQHLHSLKSLDMSDNLIEYIRNDSFDGMRELLTLTLSGNVISNLDLSAFDGLITLKQIDIADNNLTMVPTQQLSKLSNLTHLTLSGNRFSHLPAVAFLNLFHLRELRLNRLDLLRRLDSRTFVDNTHLQILYMNRNPLLESIPMRLFQGNPNIVEVHMQTNSLYTLYAAQFPIDQLEKLYLGDNPLQCNCSLFWLWRLVTGNFENGVPSSSFSLSGNGDSVNNPNYPHHLHDNIEVEYRRLSAGDLLESPGIASLDSQIPPHTTTDNLARVAAYVADRQKDYTSKFQYSSTPPSTSSYLKLDAERIGCELWRDNQKVRKHLAAMTESEITCPAHLVTIVCAILTCLLVFLTLTSIMFYIRYVKRRRKLMHDRSLRSGKSIVNVHDRILQHQPLSGNGNGVPGTLMNGTAFPTQTVPLQKTGTVTSHCLHPLQPQDYCQQTVTQTDKLELERYLTAQAIANEYRALKPWELGSVKEANAYTDEPEHLYEKFDHYDYPDTQIMTANSGTNGKLVLSSSLSKGSSQIAHPVTGTASVHAQIANTGGGILGGKPHVVYV